MTSKDKERGCGERGELLVTVLCGEATDGERAEFEAHRRACAACDEEYSALSSVREELHTWELDAIPHIRVEVRPSFAHRLRQAFAILPMSARIAGAAACVLLVLAFSNAEVSVGTNGVAIRFGIVSHENATAVQSAAAGSSLTEEQVRRMVAEQVGTTVHQELAAYREEMQKQLDEYELRLASSSSADDIKRLTVQVSTQKRRIEQLQRDVDRTAGYDGSDLFGAVLSPREPGS